MRFPANGLVAVSLCAFFAAADERALDELAAALAAKEWAVAVEQAIPLTAEGQPPKARLAATEGLAVAYCGLGQGKEFERAAQEAEALFAVQEGARLAKGKGYFRNRLQLDGIPQHAIGLLRKCQAAADAGGRAEQALAVARLLARRFPTHPERRAFALDAAERLVSLGLRDEAMPWFLAALDTGLDRCFVDEARLRENQVQLAAVATAPPLDLVARALAGLVGRAEPEVAQRFHAALVLAREADDAKAVKALRALLRELASGGGPLLPVVALELARTHLRCGHAPEAREVLEKVVDGGAALWTDAVASHREFLLGMAAGAELDRAEAAEHFAKAAASGGDALAEQALYEQARSLELAGRWQDAGDLYRKLADNAFGDSVWRAARISLVRLETLRGSVLPEPGGAVTQLPDDRETRGDWYLGYGTECFQLASLSHHGSSVRLQLAFSTTDPKEGSRRWTSAKDSPDPAAPWQPYGACRVAANHDDFGGEYPIGKGPDLLIDTNVAKGHHVLALYFANDHRYYESSRRYTVEIRSCDRLQALADVRDFGGGVYKRFLVSGPCALRVRVRRDASLNTLMQGAFLDPLPQFDSCPAPRGAEDDGGHGTYDKYARRLAARPANLARVAPLLELADSLSSARKLPPAERWFLVSRLLRASGRPRSAQRAFASFAKAVPAESLFEVARVLAKRMQDATGETGLGVRDWPEGTHPIEILNDRYFAFHYPAVTPPDEGRIDSLVGLLSGREPHATLRARRRAFPELERHAPERLTPPVLQAAATLSKEQKDPASAAVLLRRILAKPPNARTELTAAIGFLEVAPEAKAPLAEVLAVTARAQVLVKEPRNKYMLHSLHMHAAGALAAHGEYEKAIALLGATPSPITDNMAKLYRKRLAEKAKGK